MYPGARRPASRSAGEPSRYARIEGATTGGSSGGAAKPVGQSGRTFLSLVATANAESPGRVR
jgi:hypothetical protein